MDYTDQRNVILWFRVPGTLVFQTQHGQVVKLLCALYKCIYRRTDIFEELFGRSRGIPVQSRQHSILTEALIFGICCFRDTVCIQKELVSRRKEHFTISILDIVYGPEDKIMRIIMDQAERTVLFSVFPIITSGVSMS